MKNKQTLFLLLALSFFTLSKAQDVAPPAPPQQKNDLSFGVKANMAYVGIHNNPKGNGGNTIFENDYSLFLQYQSVGIFAGYTAIFGYNNYSTTHTTQTLSGFNAGLIFQLFQAKNKHHAFSICLYDVHYSATNPNYPSSGINNSMYYKEGMNFLNINPRYKYTFCKGLLSAELGVLYGAHIHDIKFKQDPYSTHFFAYSNNLQGFAVMGGVNLSFACNLSALLTKNKQ